MPTEPFSVDSALLRELGERLVGQAHIALAELIKNSYDADATVVDVIIDGDHIVVVDNGHGMTFEAFRSFWMRIGSDHKVGAYSRVRKRPLTGSKGVGRLSAQFLARSVTLRTASEEQPNQHIQAFVNWDEAIEAGELTNASADWDFVAPEDLFPDDSPHGTRIELAGLKQDWDEKAIAQLAQELWPLQPPFRGPADGGSGFEIRLQTGDAHVDRTFEQHIRRVLDLWYARVTARLLPLDDDPGGSTGGPRTLVLSVQFSDSTKRHVHRQRVERCFVDELDYEIRVFRLEGRQRYRIPVGDARDYFNQYGGVHVYDAGFHLPYYGVQTDWLRIEIDHAHRLSRSRLLPEELQVTDGLNFLPTNSRLYGVVNIDTSREIEAARKRREELPSDALTIQVSRDRLVDNLAGEDLERLVRFGLDLYAVTEARRVIASREKLAGAETIPQRVERIEHVLDAYRDELPTHLYRTLSSELRAASTAIESDAERAAGRAALLGTLATAGITAVAFEHEFNRRLGELEEAARRLQAATSNGFDRDEVVALVGDMQRAVREARETRRVFTPLLDESQREAVVSLRAQSFLRDVVGRLRIFLYGVEVDLDGVDPNLRLPNGRPAEWSALFQNLFVNAATALLDSDQRLLRVRSLRDGTRVSLRVEDTGSGVDVARSEKLFEPFTRAGELSPEKRALGFGGSGLGLTIVRMIAMSVGCDVRFVRPPADWSTSVEVTWRTTG